MKKTIFILSAAALCSFSTAQAQWTTGTGDINNTNTGNVGIGTATPTALVNIAGAHGTTQLRLTLPSGNNGGGTGEVNLQAWVSEPGISWDGAGIGTNVTNNNGANGFGRLNTSLGQSFIRFITNGGGMQFNTTANDGTYYGNTMYIAQGKVGIGTASPGSGQKLTVLMDASTNGTGVAVQAVNSSAAGSQPGYAFLDPSANKRIYTYLDVSSDTYNVGNASGSALLTVKQSGNVGIGIANPNYKLEVDGDIALPYTGKLVSTIDGGNAITLHNGFGIMKFATAGQDRIAITYAGNVGIGTSAPAQALDVRGQVKVLGGGGTNGARFGSDGTGMYLSSDDAALPALRIYGGASNMERFRIDANGNVGIGTTSPDEKLTVNGKIHTLEVIVESTVPTPDYVFKKDYELRPLKEVEAYIEKNSHLPEIPSAAEVKEKGIAVGEMNMLLLKKIEELTLYMIQQEKKNEQQSAQIAELKKELQSQKE